MLKFELYARDVVVFGYLVHFFAYFLVDVAKRLRQQKRVLAQKTCDYEPGVPWHFLGEEGHPTGDETREK